MNQKIREIIYISKSAMFTIVVHGILIVALLVGLWWPNSEKAKRGSVKPIQAQVISAEEITKQVDQQKKKLEDQKKAEEELEKLKLKQEEEKKKLEQLEVERKKKEVEKQEQEKQQKLEDKKKKEEAEKKEQAKKKKAEAEKKKKAEEEKKKKAEAEKKKKEEEKRKKEQAEKKRKEDEKRKKEAAERKKAEDALKKQLEAEQASRVRAEAATAMSALVDRIAAAVENNWRRPLNSRSGLKATIRVKVSRNGDVQSANVVKSSGDSFFDQSAELAVKKASPLPFPTDPKYYEHINEFDLLFNPDDY